MLPPFVSVSSDTGQRLRTLVLRAEHGTITYEVLRGADPLLGATDLAQPPAAQRTLDAVVSTLAAPDGGDAQDQGQAAGGDGHRLRTAAGAGQRHAGQHPERRRRPAPGEQDVHLPAVAGGADRGPRPGPRAGRPAGLGAFRARWASRRGRAAQRRHPGAGRAGRGWTATLNGTALQSVPSPAGSWAQAFRLPAGGGTLDVSHSQLGRTLIVALEALALLVVVALGLPGARVPGESAAGAAAERSAGGRRERGREKPEELAEPGLEPGLEPGSVPGEAEEPSRGSRLSRRAAAAGRAGAGRVAQAWPAHARRTGRVGRRPDRRGRPGAGPRRAGTRRTAQRAGGRQARNARPLPLRTARKRRPRRFPGADLAMDAGAAAATGFGAADGFGSDAAGPPGDLLPADLPPAVTGSPASGGFWDQDDEPDVAAGPGERALGTSRRAARSGGHGGAGGCRTAGGQDDDPAADRGGRKRWLRGRKAKERSAPEPEPETAVPSASGTGAGGRGRAGHDGSRRGDASPEYPPDQYAATGHRGGAGTGPRRRGPGDTSGPYPSPSYGSGEYPSGEYRGAGYGGPDYEGAGYGETGYGERRLRRCRAG